MQIIRPVTVTDSILSSSNVTEDDHAEWASGTTYADGDKVIVLSNHSVYESLVGSNTGNDPTTDSGDNWLRLGATNRWKAFDQKISDKVTNTTSISYTLSDDDSAITAVALFGLVGNSVNVTVTDATDGEVYNEDMSLVDTSGISDWYLYFFEEQKTSEEAQFLNIPPYFGSDVEVTVTTATGETAELGQLVVGFVSRLGVTTYGTNISIEDFSRKETDAFGNFIVVERAFAQLVDYDIQFETKEARSIQRTLASFRATPIVYIGSEDTDYGTTVYGFFRRFDLTLETPSLSFGAIEVEGLT